MFISIFRSFNQLTPNVLIKSDNLFKKEKNVTKNNLLKIFYHA